MCVCVIWNEYIEKCRFFKPLWMLLDAANIPACNWYFFLLKVQADLNQYSNSVYLTYCPRVCELPFGVVCVCVCVCVCSLSILQLYLEFEDTQLMYVCMYVCIYM